MDLKPEIELETFRRRGWVAYVLAPLILHLGIFGLTLACGAEPWRAVLLGAFASVILMPFLADAAIGERWLFPGIVTLGVGLLALAAYVSRDTWLYQTSWGAAVSFALWLLVLSGGCLAIAPPPDPPRWQLWITAPLQAGIVGLVIWSVSWPIALLVAASAAAAGVVWWRRIS